MECEVDLVRAFPLSLFLEQSLSCSLSSKKKRDQVRNKFEKQVFFTCLTISLRLNVYMESADYNLIFQCDLLVNVYFQFWYKF